MKDTQNQVIPLQLTEDDTQISIDKQLTFNLPLWSIIG